MRSTLVITFIPTELFSPTLIMVSLSLSLSAQNMHFNSRLFFAMWVLLSVKFQQLGFLHRLQHFVFLASLHFLGVLFLFIYLQDLEKVGRS